MGSHVSIDTSPPLKLVEHPLRDSIRELRRGYQSVSECLDQTMAECDQRGIELADCRRQLAEARRSLMESGKQLAEKARAEADLLNRCAEFKKQLEAAQAESVQNKQRLEIHLEHSEPLRRQIERLGTDGEASRQELTQLREQLMPMFESAAEVARLRGELAAAEGELARLREQTSQAPNQLLQEQSAAGQAERQQLESELDMLRNRGAELCETLAEQKRLAATEREKWNEELRQLRRAVERQAEVLAQRASRTNGSGQTSDASPLRPSHGSQSEDIVVDSVLEQFEALQKNKVRSLASSSG
jgi:chromosome segregation ATPase